MNLIDLKTKLEEIRQTEDDALIHYRVANKQLQVLQDYTLKQHDKYLQLCDQRIDLTKMIQRLCKHDDEVVGDRCLFCGKVLATS